MEELCKIENKNTIL